MTTPTLPRGARPAQRSTLAGARPFTPFVGAPATFIRRPPKISMWGNDVHGDCVTAEEAFAKACNDPEIFISDDTVIAWATGHNVLEGAYLTQVMGWMATTGFADAANTYDDGPYLSVDWTNGGTLHSAIAAGPVKLGVAADQIQSAYWANGGHTGWVGTGWHHDANEDHCVSLCGYGPLTWLAEQLGTTLPAGVDGSKLGYAMFTWNSIGIVDADSMVAVTQEAWLRNPTTIQKSNTGWSGFAGLGGVITSDISVGNNADGRLEIFARGTDNGLYHVWQTAPNGTWSGWAGLGGGLTSDPVVGRNADGRLEVFVRGNDGAVWHIWQTAPNGNWSGWASLGGGITSQVTVGNNQDGRLEVFARGNDNALWHIWQTTPNGNWSGWASLGGGITSDVALGNNADGRLEAFARGNDNALWHIWQTTPNGNWSGWQSLGGGLTSDISVGGNADGRLEVFARGTDNAVWHLWQTAPNSGWSGWQSLGGIITANPVVARNHDGRLEVFGRGTDNGLWHLWQTAPNSGWSGWAGLGGILTSQIAVGNNQDGRLEAFVRGTDNGVYHIWQG